jgi:hypothetical protein
MDLVNQTLGGYQIVEVIGEGGMSRVYKAYQPRLERWVAIKVLAPHLAPDSQFLARFRREARALSQLRHPNILTVYDYGEESGMAYIVTEYVSGGTLKTRLTGFPFTWPGAAALAIPLCQALAYAHERGIVHRDVKPANILMPREDWPLLADFGLVKLSQASVKLTQLGTSLGTPEYMSPEQAAGEEADARTDIYAMGVILYEMLTGRKTFAGATALEIMLQRLQSEPPSPRAHNPQIPEPIAALVLKALKREPPARFQSMGEMIAALQQGLESFAAPGLHPAPIPVTPAPVAPAPVTPVEDVVLGACPQCGAEVNLARPYCTHCGAMIPHERKMTAGRLKAVQPPAAAGAAQPVVSPATITFAEHGESLAGPRLVLANGAELLIPPKVEVLIGRADPRNHLFPDIDLAPHEGGPMGVSRNHARLVRRGEQWYLEDLKSTNGTFVDGVRLVPGVPSPLAPGCRVQCGQIVMTYREA